MTQTWSMQCKKIKMHLDAKHESSYSQGMNKLPNEKRIQILSMLVEGSYHALNSAAWLAFPSTR